MKALLDISHFSLVQIIVFGCLLLGGYYFFFYNNGNALVSSIASVQGNIDKTESEIQKQKNELKKIQDFKNELALKEKSIIHFLNYVPNELNHIDIFTLLNREAKVTGVNIEDKKDEASFVKDDYEVLKVKLKVSGSFPQVVLFLSHLTNQKRMFIVDRISMSVSHDGGLILSDMDILAFRYDVERVRREKEEKQKKEKGG